MISSLILALSLAQPPASPSAAQPAAQPAPTLAEIAAQEAPYLSQHVQLTSPNQFVRAGEAYFDHETPPRWVIFQGIPVPKEGETVSTQYGMYVAKLKRDEAGRVSGLDDAILISPPNSANTCGWFHPSTPGIVLFGSTLVAPKEDAPAGYSRDRQRYSWQFPVEMHVVAAGAAGESWTMHTPYGTTSDTDWYKGASEPSPLFDLPNGPGYAAECSWSKDGRFVLYTYRDPKTQDPDIWLYDSANKQHTPLVVAKGYDGGPFFSPDMKHICYRSDRQGNSELQLFIADLARDDAANPARITGVKNERQITADAGVVNWAPYWHPSGQYLVYASSAQGHQNYEVYTIQIDEATPPEQLKKSRITFAPGFDGLPTFSDDGRLMMWTSQRGAKLPTEQRPSSQLWIAEVSGEPKP